MHCFGDGVLIASAFVADIRLGLIAALSVLAHEVPGWLDLNVQKWAQDRYKWTIINRQTSPVFTWFFTPLSDALAWSVEHMVSLLQALRWPGVVAVLGAIGWRTGGLRAAAAGAAPARHPAPAGRS